MNKRIILGLYISFLLILSINVVNVSARAPDYVGIDEEDVYAWEIDFKKGAWEDFEDDGGDEYMELDDLEDYEIVKIVIDKIGSEEDVEIAGDPYPGSEIDLLWYESESKDTVKYDEDDEETVIFDGENVDPIIAAISIWVGTQFICTNLDWDTLEDGFDDFLWVYADDWTVDAEENKVSVTIQYTDMPEETEIKTTYDKHGVLQSYEVSYDGDTIVKIKDIDPPEELLIPGYPAMILFGATLVSIIGVIKIILKKKY